MSNIPEDVKQKWKELVSCTCNEMYKSRGMIDQNCVQCEYEYLAEEIYSLALPELTAKEEEIAKLKEEVERGDFAPAINP